MFNTLLQLPLLQGLAREDFTQILAKVKLSFSKYYPGDTIVHSGDSCCQLIYILKGKYATKTTSSDGNFSLIEEWQSPTLLFPHSLFGMSTCYPASCMALEETHVVRISKSEMLNELFKYEIFRLNYMNILSNRAQTFQNKVWTTPSGNIEQRIYHFIHSLCERPVGTKTLKINMIHLGTIINETRLSVSHALNNLQALGVIELHRSEIVIPALEKLHSVLFTSKTA